ncbi:hypothetical protein [Novosphingobium sp.]|uniref:hypothetical protein n=1 Tax=Novosphingobium sp. TaxID=1874826 RepID=UPI00262034B1|nr:hypothetical protein [Novosphingobium sp.]
MAIADKAFTASWAAAVALMASRQLDNPVLALDIAVVVLVVSGATLAILKRGKANA